MLQFRILGPLEIADESGPIELRGQRQRRLLAVLLLRANEIVPTDSLLEALWGAKPPKTAETALQNGISELRKSLGSATIETRPRSYRLRVDPEQLDAVQFRQLLEDARGQPPEQRAQTLATALKLWRQDEPLADLTFEEFVQAERHRLLGLQHDARIERLDAELACGRHADIVSEAESLAAHDPLNERLANIRITALYRCGRQAEAMQVYQAMQKSLKAQGQLPGPELRETHALILRHSPALAAPARSAHAREDRLGDLVRAALASRLVPVLGPVRNGSAPAPDPAAAAKHLAQHFACPPAHHGCLTRVGQWIAVTHGVGPLYDELHSLYARDFPPERVHRMLAALPALLRARGLPCQLLLTTGFDRTLEQAFKDAGETYDVVSFIALGPDRGKFLHIGADGSSRVIDEPNLEVDLAPPDRTLIVKLNGGTDELSGRVRDSYVVSEDDYIDYLSQSDLTSLLPVGLAARIRLSHLLFIGYELEEWSLRVFLRRLWGRQHIAYQSWAIDPEPDRFTAGQWRQLGVDVLTVGAEDALDDLCRRLAEEPTGSAA
jgi:DNA-binding SARP family transcriptional activator